MSAKRPQRPQRPKQQRQEDTDFAEEGRKLWTKLGLDPSQSQQVDGRTYSPLDVVFCHPESGGQVFVGNLSAASEKKILKAHNITHIVNCQEKTSRNYHEADPTFSYFRFSVSFWFKELGMNSHHGVRKYMKPFLEFVDNAIAEGNNVLIHCLAGAHRAGTSGVAYLMHAADLTRSQALVAAKSRRPIINPLSHLMDLLVKFDAARQDEKS